MAIKVIGTGYTFGADSDNPNAQSVSINATSDEAVALNNVGDPVAAALYNGQQEVSIELLATDGDVPEIGSTITANGKTFVITSVNLNSSNTDFARYSVSGKIWGSLTAQAQS